MIKLFVYVILPIILYLLLVKICNKNEKFTSYLKEIENVPLNTKHYKTNNTKPMEIIPSNNSEKNYINNSPNFLISEEPNNNYCKENPLCYPCPNWKFIGNPICKP